MKRRTLGIGFIIGILLCGLGSGVAFAQYSSFKYGGEISMGEADTTSTYEFEIIKDRVEIYCYLPSEREIIIEDDSVPEGTVMVEVTYNSNYIDGIYLNTWENNIYDDEDRSVQEVGIGIDYSSMDEVKSWFDAKDQVLEGLKDGKVMSIRAEYIDSVTIRVNPKDAYKLYI